MRLHPAFRQCFAVIIPAILLYPAGVAYAQLACYQCHGSDGDYRPLDAPYRNMTTGGFRGNHRTHMDAAATPVSCGTCHPGSSGYTSSHRDGAIKLAPNIHNSPLTARYRNSSSAFPQTATPDPGSCTNVSCHFERETKSWGSTPLSVPDGCRECHGAPPAGGNGGAGGSHARHGNYYGGTGRCSQCHADHLAEAKPFAHATSAGRRPLIVELHDPQGTPGGSYSGPLDDYLPVSQTNLFGSCSDLYCHSNGTSVATGSIPGNTTPRWGTPTPGCDSCHGYPPAYANGSPKANSHGRHAAGCNFCHSSVTSDGSTITAPNGPYGIENHVDKAYTVVAGSGASFTYLYAASGGSCSAISCHGNGNATWGTTVACGGCHALPPPTGAHLAHTDGGGALYGSDDNGSTTTAYRFNCGNCHPMDGSGHGNGVVDVELYNAAATGLKRNNPPAATRTGSGAATVCLNIYCHSSGQDTGVRSYAPTPQWGATFAGNRCAGCHGDPPSYPSGGAGTPDANSHYTVTTPPGESSPVEGGHLIAIHFDNIRLGSQYPDGGLVPKGGVPGSGAAHGDPATSTTISCPTCHAATVATASQHSAPGTSFSCTPCHISPLTATIADKSRHVNGARDVAFMTGTLQVKAQLRLASFTSMVRPLGAVRNSFKTYSAHDSIPFSGSYNPAAKNCTTVCHLNQTVRWGDTQVTCISCHADL